MKKKTDSKPNTYNDEKLMFKTDRKLKSFFFLACDGKKWHTQCHVEPLDFPEFLLRMMKNVMVLFGNPNYDVPDPFMKFKLKPEDNQMDKMIG